MQGTWQVRENSDSCDNTHAYRTGWLRPCYFGSHLAAAFLQHTSQRIDVPHLSVCAAAHRLLTCLLLQELHPLLLLLLIWLARWPLLLLLLLMCLMMLRRCLAQVCAAANNHRQTQEGQSPTMSQYQLCAHDASALLSAKIAQPYACTRQQQRFHANMRVGVDQLLRQRNAPLGNLHTCLPHTHNTHTTILLPPWAAACRARACRGLHRRMSPSLTHAARG